MKIKNISIVLTALASIFFANHAAAQTSYIEEDPLYIRFEQYTGISGTISFWRLPSPGTSTFPGGTCTNLKIPNDRPEHASRFMALYLFAKTNNKKVFYIYNTGTCVIVSFGTNG
jgi:hypothetical protein